MQSVTLYMCEFLWCHQFVVQSLILKHLSDVKDKRNQFRARFVLGFYLTGALVDLFVSSIMREQYNWQ